MSPFINVVFRVVIAATLIPALVAPAFATVLEQASEDEKALKRCVQLQKWGQLPAKKIDHLPNDGDARVWRIQGQRGVYLAFIMGVGARAACQVYKTNKPAAKLTSVLHPAKGAIEAVILHGEVCNDDDGCAAALLYRERNGSFISAMRTDGCTRGEKLKKIRLFPGNHRSVLRQCRHGHGPEAYEEVMQIIHHDGKSSKIIGEFEVGSSKVTRKPKGKKVQVCVHPAPGSVRPGGWGPAPKVKVRVPSAEAADSVDEATWTWDIKAQEFVQGKATTKKVKIAPACHVEAAKPKKKRSK